MKWPQNSWGLYLARAPLPFRNKGGTGKDLSQQLFQNRGFSPRSHPIMTRSNLRTPSTNCGHVFFLHCDSSKMAADAVLVPGNPGPKRGVVEVNSAKDGMVHTFEAADVRRAGNPDEVLSQGLEIVLDFLNAATSAVGSHPSKFKRSKPLLALPLPGVGQMDPEDIVHDEGRAVEAVLPILYNHVDKHGVDIALCTTQASGYAVLQVHREKFCPFKGGPFWMLSKKLQSQAKELSEQVLNGALSVFFGAGVSYPSGLPSWGGLLEDLAIKAGFTDKECEALKKLDYLDQPTLIEEKMGHAFRPAIAACVKGGRYTPAHAILSELRVPTATTNYDELFELTVDTCSETIFRLPWASTEVSTVGTKDARTITKLHGCVSHPRDIVLTRQDYMRYEDDRRALRGVVHQFLLTTNILFVGFSMTDDNLHRVIDEAREVLSRKNDADSGKLGTITSLIENEMFRHLWDQDFNVISFGESWADNPAWIHDCFFDCLGALVASHKAKCSFILDPKYENLLSESERTIRDAFGSVLEISKDPKVQNTEAWQTVKKLLAQLGAPL